MSPARNSTALSHIPAGWIWLCRVAGVLGVAVGTALAQQGTPVRAKSVDASGLRHAWVTSSRTFDHVNSNDARAALKVWFDIIAQQKGFSPDSPTIDIVDSVTEVRERLKSHSVEMVTLSVTEYLELESSGLMVPVLTDVRSGQSGALYSYVLLVNPASG